MTAHRGAPQVRVGIHAKSCAPGVRYPFEVALMTMTAGNNRS
jgi:hypothetical protein